MNNITISFEKGIQHCCGEFPLQEMQEDNSFLSDEIIF